MFHILVVEDDTNARKLMKAVLERAEYCVIPAVNGEDALSLLDSNHVDLILLDIMMPGMDGYTLATELRAAGNTVPILMITAKQLPADKRKGFISGTDDYMTKPVDTEEMLLRIKALLRRSRIVSERKLTIGSVELDYDALTVSRGDDHQTLPQKEFYLLYKLLSSPTKSSRASSSWTKFGAWSPKAGTRRSTYTSTAYAGALRIIRSLSSSPCAGWAIRR